MPVDKNDASPSSIPDGYAAIPLHEPGTAPVRLCLLVQRRPDPATGALVLLRDLPDARVYLGCLTDAGGRVLDWLELWVQNLDGLAGSLSAVRENLSNAVLDARWTRQVAVFREINPEGFLETGWESHHPSPIFLDAAAQHLLHPNAADAAGAWKLCRDDFALQAAGLPPYATSLFRYLHQPSGTDETKFVPAIAGAPENAATRPLAEILGGSSKIAVNPQGGLMMATRFSPIPYEDYADLLGGKTWNGLAVGKKFLPLGGVYHTLADWNEIQQQGAHLLLGRQGSAGRLVETFHLKLQLFTEAATLVRTAVAAQQVPFLNLGADSFAVRLDPAGAKLPFFWTASTALVKSSQAFALPLESSEFTYFVRTQGSGTSVYLPENLGRPLQGQGSVRIRQLLPGEQGRTTVEGTLVMQEPLTISPRDLLCLRLPLPSGRVDLYGHIYADEGLAQGEVRFRTRAQSLPDAVVKNLTAAAGVPLPRAPFEIVPLLSSPCDLHALGVLAARTLLVDEKNTLAMAVDELLSLARRVASEHDPKLPLGQRIGAIFKKESRYAATLGAHHLLRDSLDPAQAAALLPAELWFDTLGAIVRLFPGAGPDSICRDFGDAPSLALETVLNQAVDDFDKLLVRSRSLLVIDWQQNREIQSVIEKQRAGAGR